MFDRPPFHQHHHLRLADHISIAALVISIVINTLVTRINRDIRSRRELYRCVMYLLAVMLGCFALALICVLLMIFAFDFFKIAIIVVISYVALTKIVLSAML